MRDGELTGYQEWVAALFDVDVEGDGGTRSVGWEEFTREVFRIRGGISYEAYDRLCDANELELAEQAVALVEADLRRTVGRDDMTFDVAIRPIDADDDLEMLVVSFRGSYQTPVLFSLRHPEATAEVADNMQDHIVDELHRAWPVCPSHDRGLYAWSIGNEAVWYCKAGDHAVAPVGRLPREAGR